MCPRSCGEACYALVHVVEVSIAGLYSLTAALQDCCETVVDAQEPRSSALLARDVAALSYAVYLAAAEGRAIDLAPYLR